MCGSWEPGRVGVRLSSWNAFNSMADSDTAAAFGFVAGVLQGFGQAYLHVVEASVGAEGVVPQPSDSWALKAAFGGDRTCEGGL